MRYLSLLLLALLAAYSVAQTPNPALESTITGNQEQPQVSYIVPWQDPEQPGLTLELTSSVASGVFDHLEPDELQRMLNALPDIAADESTAVDVE